MTGEFAECQATAEYPPPRDQNTSKDLVQNHLTPPGVDPWSLHSSAKLPWRARRM